MTDFPVLRSHERIDYKRCPKKWYWKWRKGFVPRAQTFGALNLGTWMHEALAKRYTDKRRAGLRHWFNAVAGQALIEARIAEVPDHEYEKAEELAKLGLAMAGAYDKHYGKDEGIKVIDAEIPLEIEISDENRKLIALHKLKPDLLYEDHLGNIWLMEHKTAASIRTEHLPIDDQARPYVVMAELALRNNGMLKGRTFAGVMYNFLRKAVPDERPRNKKGLYLNKNGSVSKSQPPPYFIRHPVTLTRQAKIIASTRLQVEAAVITSVAQAIREKRLDPAVIPKTPHNSCPKTCQYFAMCVVEEQGGNIRDMQLAMYTQVNPYTYDEETTDIPLSFEMG